ncbi:MAG: hypothetical protein IKV29_06555 [Alistipes sp.]|nr:hypothetical protein [Alistipes sp.]
MKKLLLALVAMLMVASVSAQQHKNSIGLRLGWGVEAQYERHFSSKNYLEANLGLYGFNEFSVNATYNWNLCEWNWTPSVGKWFLSAGVGGSLSAWKGGYFNVGVAGDVAFGLRFKKPFTLSLDYRPTLYFLHNAWGHGFAGVALTCTYNF